MLKEYREYYGMTKAGAARVFGVTHKAYRMWENGQRTPDIDHIAMMSDQFNIDYEDLLIYFGKGDHIPQIKQGTAVIIERANREYTIHHPSMYGR